MKKGISFLVSMFSFCFFSIHSVNAAKIIEVETSPIVVENESYDKVTWQDSTYSPSPSSNSSETILAKSDQADDVDMNITNKPSERTTPKTIYGNEKYLGSNYDRHMRNNTQPSTVRISPNTEYIREGSDLVLRQKEFTFGPEVYYHVYREPIANVRLKGAMYGAHAAYTYRADQRKALFTDLLDVYKVEGRGAYGQVDYESDPSGRGLESNPDVNYEVRVLTGKDLALGRKSMVTPYFGFGYNYLNDDSSGIATTTGALGYERVANYYYAPLGFEFKHQCTKTWRIETTAEYDFFIFGEQKSFLSDVSPALPNLKNKQRKGYGLRGAVRIVKEEPKVNLFVEPFVRYWHIRDSDEAIAVGPTGIALAGYEPDNTTEEWGLKLGVQF